MHPNKNSHLFPPHINTKPIISVSRRTDIPAHYGNEFINSVQRGYIQVENPFNRTISTISLRPEDIGALVFWSKNYRPFLQHLKIIDETYHGRFIFHFTINNFSGNAKTILEPNIPDAKDMIETLIYLSETYGRDKIMFRYDPIIFSNLTPPDERLEAFEEIVRMAGKYFKRCYTSFIDLYSKVKRRLHKIERSHPIKFARPTRNEQIIFLKNMKTIAQYYGIELFTCCEEAISFAAGVNRGRCIDARLLQKLFPDITFTSEIRPTRQGCGCYYSIDIGKYNTCKARCIYCYANR